MSKEVNTKQKFIPLLSALLISLCCSSYIFASGVATGKAAKNDLYEHASPYLAMHGRDPVRWHEWNEKTVAMARKQNKLLFVSSGYFSCHWCHVMQRESYQNAKVAALLNKYFIPVKVDRELNSALDTLLIDFTERTQGQAGWPLNVFVTPEGYPLVGMTYLPVDNFIKVLELLEQRWQAEQAGLKGMAQQASLALAKVEVSTSTQINPSIVSELKTIFLKQTMSNIDEMQGGYGKQNKFPNVPKLITLLEMYASDKSNQDVKEFLQISLNQMASQGLLDQLGGGFYRYTVDPNWQVPHFEKMLYDNALLASLYFRAADVFASTAYRSIATQTLDFILTDLQTNEPAYAASLSAVDEQGIEGGYYLWHLDEVKQNLSPAELNVVVPYWGLQGTPDLDDGHHLVQTSSIEALAKELKLPSAEIEKQITSARKKLLDIRSKRTLPKDQKILTAWNALTLKALTEGAAYDKKYHQAAQQLATYIKQSLWNEKTKTLYRAKGKKGILGDGNLEDYAYTAQAFYAYWQFSQDAEDLRFLESVLSQAWARFYSKQGWILAEKMLLKYATGHTMISDGPLPSPSSVLIHTTLKFAQKNKHPAMRDQALRALNVGFEQLRQEGLYYAMQINALMAIQNQ